MWEVISWCVTECDCETGGVGGCPQRLCSLGDGRVSVPCLVGFSGCDVSPVYLCSCVSLDNCSAIVGEGRSHTEGASGPRPLCSVPAHRGVSFSPLGFPPSPPPEQHPTVSRAPPASLQRRVLWPSCLIAVAYGAYPHPVCTFHSAPLPLVAHNEGGFRGSPTLSARS